MNVTLCSIFRNSVGYVDRYFSQVHALSGYVDLRLVLTYGDCTDATGPALEAAADRYEMPDVEIGQCDHGGPVFPSIDHPQRWDQIALVVRSTLDRVGDPGDALIWVESDLEWSSQTMLKLLDDLAHVPAVAPQNMHATSERFYDTWGFRIDSVGFNAWPPYHQGTPDPDTGLVKIDSCGSCFVTKADYWRGWSGHWPYTAGGDLWLDETVAVRHP
ncbi:MAG TPA: hypothetical protein VFH70_04400 [Acidimicrobiales bacterium]|nr:hypothetical protein [Acidimicrobiales bacterium]